MKLYKIKLEDGADFEVYVDDIDLLHKDLVNNAGAIMFLDFERNKMLIKSSAIIAVWED